MSSKIGLAEIAMGVALGFAACAAIAALLSFLYCEAAPDPLPVLPSQTQTFDGGNLTISAGWGIPGKLYYLDVVAEGERTYNATIYRCNAKDDPRWLLNHPSRYEVLATINKTQPRVTTYANEIGRGYYPFVVFDDGTFVQFMSLQSVPW